MGSSPSPPGRVFTAKDLVTVHESRHKQVIGEQLFSLIKPLQPGSASVITGMLLELDNEVLFGLLADASALERKVEDAVLELQDKAAVMFSANGGPKAGSDGVPLNVASSSSTSPALGSGSANVSSLAS